MTSDQIISHLPYGNSFLFVDELIEFTEEHITGNYTFRKDAYYYNGHFKDHPVTPGVILTEVMAQIGVVCLGVFLMKDALSNKNKPQIALTSSDVDFFIPVFPEEKVTVISEKEYFRFNKLKCKVKMINEKGDLICRGHISGFITNQNTLPGKDISSSHKTP